MIHAEALQIHILRESRYRAILWAAITVAAYLLAYSLATTNADTEFGNWPRTWEPPIQEPIDDLFGWIGDNFAWFFNPISEVIDTGLAGIDTFLLWLPWPVVVAAASMLGLRLGGWRLGLFCGAGYPVHRPQRVLGLRDGHFERTWSFSDYRCGAWCANRHIRCLQQSLRGSRPPDSRHHAGPACLRIPHPRPRPVRSERRSGHLPYGCLLHPARHQAHQPGDPPSPAGRYRDGPLARFDDTPDAVSGAAATGKELDHDGHQPDHNDGGFHSDNYRARGSGRARQGRMAFVEGGGCGEGSGERHRHCAPGHHPGQV